MLVVTHRKEGMYPIASIAHSVWFGSSEPDPAACRFEAGILVVFGRKAEPVGASLTAALSDMFEANWSLNEMIMLEARFRPRHDGSLLVHAGSPTGMRSVSV